MKKVLLLMMLLMSGMNMMADDGQKLDAAKISEISFNGDDVIILFTDGTSQTFDMGDTEKPITIDFSNVLGMAERLQMTQALGLEGKQVYDLKGNKVGKSAAALKKGVYVIKGKKVIIRSHDCGHF